MFNAFKWFATFTSIAGSFLVASGIMDWGYIFFTVGSVSWLVVAHVIKDKPLFILNLVFTVADIIGIFNFIL
jgi:hypothetical protein